MKHLKIFEAFGGETEGLEITVDNNILNLIKIGIDEIGTDTILYDYDISSFMENSEEEEDDSEDAAQSIQDTHDALIDNLDEKKYYDELLLYIKDWFTEEANDIIIDNLPFITHITLDEISFVKNKGRLLDMTITVKPMALVSYIMEMMNVPGFTDRLNTLYRSYDGFVSFFPSNEMDIIKILEASDYEEFWKLLTVAYDFSEKEIQDEIGEGSSLYYYLAERMSESIYEFQK
jgi:hypothetical protein